VRPAGLGTESSVRTMDVQELLSCSFGARRVGLSRRDLARVPDLKRFPGTPDPGKKGALRHGRRLSRAGMVPRVIHERHSERVAERLLLDPFVVGEATGEVRVMRVLLAPSNASVAWVRRSPWSHCTCSPLLPSRGDMRSWPWVEQPARRGSGRNHRRAVRQMGDGYPLGAQTGLDRDVPAWSGAIRRSDGRPQGTVQRLQRCRQVQHTPYRRPRLQSRNSCSR
jgi:hypothetical protein